MKIAFIIASACCALALTALSLIVATGKAPFAKPAERVDAQAAPPAKNPLTVFSGQQEVIDDMINDLKAKQELYDEKLAELATRENNLRDQEKIMNGLKEHMKELQARFDQLLVETKRSEAANFKHLADVYSKMAPDNAASLLRQMDDERAAVIVSMIGERQAAAILNSLVSTGDEGAKTAAQWSDIIRRMKKETKNG